MAIDTTCQEAFAKTTFGRNAYFCGKHAHNGVKFETGVVHRGPLQGLIVWLRGPFPAACNDLAIARDQGGILEQLDENEMSQQTRRTGRTRRQSPRCEFARRKWSTAKVEAVKTHNQAISSLHVIVENRNDNYARFGVCKQSFRHSKSGKDGPNMELLGRCWDTVTFLINRNVLDSAGQTAAWSTPVRPLLPSTQDRRAARRQGQLPLQLACQYSPA